MTNTGTASIASLNVSQLFSLHRQLYSHLRHAIIASVAPEAHAEHVAAVTISRSAVREVEARLFALGQEPNGFGGWL